VVSTPTGHVGKTLDLGVHPDINYWTIALNPHGQTSYVLGYGSPAVPGVAIPFNTATLAVGKPVTVGDNAGQIAFAPSGKWAYVLDDGIQRSVGSLPGKVVPINVATGSVGRPIPVAGYAEAMAAS
jgi:DNA-binding beta-propeller fold protein YncE